MRAFSTLFAMTLTALTASDSQAQFGGPTPFYPRQNQLRPQYQSFPQYYPGQQVIIRPDRKSIERNVAYQLRQALCNCGVKDVEVDINSSCSRVEVELTIRKGMPRQLVRKRAWYALQSMPQLQGMRIELDIDD